MKIITQMCFCKEELLPDWISVSLVQVKVCFDDIQLERVCEYPSEDCTHESLPCAPHPGSEDGRCGGDQEEDEDEENTSRSDMKVNAGRLRFLRVGQCLYNHIIKTNKQQC